MYLLALSIHFDGIMHIRLSEGGTIRMRAGKVHVCIPTCNLIDDLCFEFQFSGQLFLEFTQPFSAFVHD